MKTWYRNIWVLSFFLFAGLGNAEPNASNITLTLDADPTDESQTEAVDENLIVTTVQSLESLLKSIESKEEGIARLQKALKKAPDEVTREERLGDLKKVKEEADAQVLQFVKFAVGVDVQPFIEEPEKEFNWQDELGKLLKPILAELENATSGSRAISELRDQIGKVDERRETARQAVENLELLVNQKASPELEQRLAEELQTWSRRLDDAQNEQTALELQLNNRLSERKSLLDSTTSFARQFFRTRGMNLLLGISAFCTVFFGIRLLGRGIQKVQNRTKGENFGRRLSTLLFQVFSIVGGLLAMLLVFNMAGDWFLLGIVIVFLLGVGWASINTIPEHVETIKLVLNMGAVREGERIVFDGSPWCVDSLSFSARLVNPLLDGGVQKLPVKYLIGMHSRPKGEKEEWFPSREGDWVELSNGRKGCVSYQTPSIVQLVELGGSQIVYQTPDFLALTPRNLSTNFRILSTFGVDYKHQAICTTDIPRKMKERLEKELPDIVEADQVLNIDVDFMVAAASSLDYRISVDLKGQSANRYGAIRNEIQRILVDACTENGWEIPFTQVTLHQAEE